MADTPENVQTSRFGAKMSFVRAAEATLRLRERHLPEVSDTEWRLLVTLAGTPEDSAKRSISSIAAGAGVPIPTAVRTMAILHQRGLVARAPHPTDRRVILVRLTEFCKRTMGAIEANWSDIVGWAIALPIAAAFICDMGGSAVARDAALPFGSQHELSLDILGQ